MATTHTSTGQSDAALADKVASTADAAIEAARRKDQSTLDGISDAIRSVKDQANATLKRLTPPYDAVTTYVQQEPTKALLIAAAAGAGIMGLVALIGSSGNERRMSSAESLRKAARDVAENLRQAGRDAAGKAAAQADGAVKSTRGSVKAAYDGLTDTVQHWKDQAAPIVDRIRPQIDNVATYTKEEPGKALLIAIATGAALMGLVSSMRR